MEMDSYTAAAQLALGGVAPALVPISIVKTLKIDSAFCIISIFLMNSPVRFTFAIARAVINQCEFAPLLKPLRILFPQ